MQCEICKLPRKTIQSLSRHVKNDHGMEFKMYYDKFLLKEGEGVCNTCNNPTKFFKGKYSTYCCNACINNDPQVKQKMSISLKQTLSKKSKSDWLNINDKRKKTVSQKYGVENISQIESIRVDRSKNCHLRSEENRQLLKTLDWDSIQVKRENTNVQKYGFKTPAKNDTVKLKISNTKRKDFLKNIDRFESVATPLFDLNEYEGGKTKPYPWLCSVCGCNFKAKIDCGKLPRCLKCYPKIKSKLEKIIIDFLTEQGVRVKQNDRTIIHPLELDLFLIDYNIAIEVNGLYYHSEISGGKDKNYHLKKTKLCEENNITLLHIFEDEILSNKEIVFSKLKNMISQGKKGIYARNCILSLIDSKTKNFFLDANHLQGGDKSSIGLGAFYKDELVSVMSFSKGRKCLNSRTIDGQWELSRFCSKLNTNVIGIASKLLTHFEREYNPNKITTYADRRWSTGNLYDKIGFEFSHFSKPNYWYYKYGYYVRYHRFNYRKNVLHKKLEQFNPDLTEWENMQINGWDRIWDCGTYVFQKTYPTKNVGGGVSAKPSPV